MKGSCKVYVVVDPAFREQLRDLPPNVPVWVVDTPENASIVRGLWKERHSPNHLTGITTFCVEPEDSPEDNLIDELDTIDLHHGLHSSNPPYSKIEVIGVTLSERIKSALAQYGFQEFRATPHGFEASRVDDSE
jgi:hypothetical protein